MSWSLIKSWSTIWVWIWQDTSIKNICSSMLLKRVSWFRFGLCVIGLPAESLSFMVMFGPCGSATKMDLYFELDTVVKKYGPWGQNKKDRSSLEWKGKVNQCGGRMLRNMIISSHLIQCSMLWYVANVYSTCIYEPCVSPSYQNDPSPVGVYPLYPCITPAVCRY